MKEIRQTDSKCERNKPVTDPAERQYRLIVGNLTDSVILTDEADKITAWLGASEKIFGLREEEARGQPLQKYLPCPPGKLIPQDEFSGGITCKHKSGREIIIRIVQKRKMSGEIVLWICRDVTVYKKIEWLLHTFHDEVQAELQKLVNKKTADLKKLNNQLEKKVADRTRELERIQQKMIEKAHKAGMTEVAIHNLHTIGNILNNITTALYFLEKNLENPDLERFRMANKLFREKIAILPAQPPHDKFWAALINYYQQIASSFVDRFGHLRSIGKKLETGVEQINYILTTNTGEGRNEDHRFQGKE